MRLTFSRLPSDRPDVEFVYAVIFALVLFCVGILLPKMLQGSPVEEAGAHGRADHRPIAFFLPGYHNSGCGFFRVTGIPCPGCGGTRAAFLTLHGKPGLAFRYNPLAALITLSACFWVVYMTVIQLFNLPRARIKLSGKEIYHSRWLLAVLLGVHWWHQYTETSLLARPFEWM